MALTVQDIITRVRDTLADDGTRWAEDRLIRVIDEAQKNICRRAKVLRYSTNIIAKPSQNTYTLPSDVQVISRVLYNDNKLLPVGANSAGLETLEGIPKYFTTNKMERGLLKIIPTPVFTENYPFDLSKANTITVYYVKKPKTLASSSDELEIDELYSTVLKHYIVGTLLREDTDAQNRAFGNEEISLYEQELAQLITEVSKDFNINPVFETKYWRT